MKVVTFLEPPQAEVIEKILRHCGLWQSSTPRTPLEVDGLVLELDAAYSDSSVGSSDQADEPQDTLRERWTFIRTATVSLNFSE